MNYEKNLKCILFLIQFIVFGSRMIGQDYDGCSQVRRCYGKI